MLFLFFFNVTKVEYLQPFLIICLGLLLGGVKVKGFSLGIVSVVFLALIGGYFGVVISPVFKRLGIAFFVYAIGNQAGTHIEGAFKHKGFSYFLYTFMLVSFLVFLVVIFSFCFRLEPSYLFGVLSGCLSSTVGLLTASQMLNDSSALYAVFGITLPFAILTAVLTLKLVPIIFRINLNFEKKEFKHLRKYEQPKLELACVRVTNRIVLGKSYRSIFHVGETNLVLLSVKNSDTESLSVGSDYVFRKGDVLRFVGTEEEILKVKKCISSSKETKFLDLPDSLSIEWVVLSNVRAVSKLLSDLHDTSLFQIAKIKRDSRVFFPKSDFKLRFGDKLLLLYRKENRKSVHCVFGNKKSLISQVSVLSVFIPIVLGSLLGEVVFPVFHFKLGVAAGVLLVSMYFSYLGKTGIFVWNVPKNIVSLLKEIGLMIFLAYIGISTGGHFMESIQSGGLFLILAVCVIVFSSIIFSVFIGRKVFKFNFLVLMGLVSGGFTSTPSLSVVNEMLNDDSPTISYSIAYPFSMVILFLYEILIGFLIL